MEDLESTESVYYLLRNNKVKKGFVSMHKEIDNFNYVDLKKDKYILIKIVDENSKSIIVEVKPQQEFSIEQNKNEICLHNFDMEKIGGSNGCHVNIFRLKKYQRIPIKIIKLNLLTISTIISLIITFVTALTIATPVWWNYIIISLFSYLLFTAICQIILKLKY